MVYDTFDDCILCLQSMEISSFFMINLYRFGDMFGWISLEICYSYARQNYSKNVGEI